MKLSILDINHEESLKDYKSFIDGELTTLVHIWSNHNLNEIEPSYESWTVAAWKQRPSFHLHYPDFITEKITRNYFCPYADG